MNVKIAKACAAMALVVALIPPALAAKINLEPTSESGLWLEGDSTLHPFSSTAAAVSASLTVDAASAAPEAVLAAIAGQKPAALMVAVPVAGLKSAHSGLDKNLRKALKADRFADVVFEMSSYKLKDGRISVAGSLSIAGATRPIEIEVSASAAPGGLVVRGERDVLMTDFGIKPPTAMLGAIKTKDRITVKFRLVLAEAKGEKK